MTCVLVYLTCSFDLPVYAQSQKGGGAVLQMQRNEVDKIIGLALMILVSNCTRSSKLELPPAKLTNSLGPQ